MWNVFYIAIAVIISLITVILTTIYLKRSNLRKTKTLRGADVLHLLKSQKPFPIGYPAWRLYKFENDQRLWHSQLVSELLSKSLSIYGTFAKVKASSQIVLNTLKDITKYHEWNPGVCQTRQITVADEVNQPSKYKGSSSGVVQHDIVSLEIEHMPYVLARIVNWCWYKIQGDGLLRLVSIVHRFWNKQEGNSWWFLEIIESEQKWYFYLMQNIEGFFEIDQVLVSVISYPNDDAAIKLACLQHILSYRKVQTTPLTTLTLPCSKLEDTEENESLMVNPPSQVQSNCINATLSEPTDSTKVKQNKNFADVVEEATKANNIATPINSLVPTNKTDFVFKFKQLIEEKKEWFKNDDKKKKNQTKDAATILKSSDSETINTLKSGKPLVETKFFSRFLRSNTLPGALEDMDCKDKILKSTRNSTSVDYPTFLEDETESLQDVNQDQVLFTDEELSDKEHNLEEIYRKAANDAVVDLMEEKSKIANLDITKGMESQAESTGGWVYCGLEKEIVILRKLFDDVLTNQSQCYLGKGVVPAPPKIVFEAIRNPQTRFTYDDMLKKIDILKDFGNGLKIIYMYHEVSQLFRKEARDFCIVQLEKVEGMKYIVSMRSVGWPGCQENVNITRAKVHPSGWIIEPITRNQKLYSMVTYIVQFELGLSKTGNGYLVEELAAKQPLSISFLKQLLTANSTEIVDNFNKERRNTFSAEIQSNSNATTII